MAASDARPLPLRLQAFRLNFWVFDNTGAPVPGAADLAAQISMDNGAFAAPTNPPVEVGNGYYYLDLTAGEMDCYGLGVIITTSTTDAKSTCLTIYPAQDIDLRVNLVSWNGTLPHDLVSGKVEADVQADPAIIQIETSVGSLAADMIVVSNYLSGVINPNIASVNQTVRNVNATTVSFNASMQAIPGLSSNMTGVGANLTLLAGNVSFGNGTTIALNNTLNAMVGNVSFLNQTAIAMNGGIVGVSANLTLAAANRAFNNQTLISINNTVVATSGTASSINGTVLSLNSTLVAANLTIGNTLTTVNSHNGPLSSINATTLALNTTLNSIPANVSLIDSNLSLVKAKTDLIPASPASVGSQMNLADGAITDAKITLPTEATGTPSTFLQLVMWVAGWLGWRKVIKDSNNGTMTQYMANSSTVKSTSTYTSSGGIDTINKAT